MWFGSRLTAPIRTRESNMNVVKTSIATAAIGLIASIAWAQTTKMSAQDFATMAASSDLFEIQSSEMALQKAESAEVKEFAQMMIDDHSKASKELMAAAQQDGAAVPEAMTDKHAAQVETLKGASGATFDASYIGAQVAGHQEALNLMTSYAEAGDSAALKAHAEKTAPVIQMHLEHVQKLDQNM
jgi:putative membrane protein